MSDYYALRDQIAKMVPRTLPLVRGGSKQSVQEKGRKKGYKEFKLSDGQWASSERLLKADEIGSFVEVSCRAAACPMPLNMDVYDSLKCPFGCKYCFADSFRGTLYTAFFDNARTVGLRHCNVDYCKSELDKLMGFRGKSLDMLSGGSPNKEVNKRVARVSASGKKYASRGGRQECTGGLQAALQRAVAAEIPMRLGIRFEDFLPIERKLGISLQMLEYLADQSYPTMINTKSDVVGYDKYVEALARNQGKAAVHMTLISSNNALLKELEPGAPSYDRRIWAMKQLSSAGVRVVARIEPFLVFLSDPPDEVDRYMADLKDAGVSHLTFDTYSWTAKNPGIRQSFFDMGLDWERLFLLGCDSQGLGSLLMGEFMSMWREHGFSCSSFDMGNVPDNDQSVCCEVGDWFEGGMNWGCTVMAARFVKDRGMTPSTWGDFKSWVEAKGGFLSDGLELEVHQLWNADGTSEAYSQQWARGLEVVGTNQDGLIWQFDDSDFRKELVR
ncbi:hypothetical protein M0R72_14755 [Candidatus Pacearchaeota archaeon]|jgi:DNA repair photolyase|nr:hypothetical protein [Candidatus Pacearchaeota archaeon]